MHKLLLLLFLCFSSLSFSQVTVVSGRCVDARGKAIEEVSVSAKNAITKFIYTGEDGRFEMHFLGQLGATIFFKLDQNDKLELDLLFDQKDSIDIGDFKFPYQVETEIRVIEHIENPHEAERLKLIDLAKMPMGGVPRFIALTTAASSNNELTSNYNVRGGSYDENLVYVNGFNIYRPFLTRSGQQEGMSFINSALVSSIQFSGGGFNAEYGDKLSSVLDITYRTPGVNIRDEDSLEGSAVLSVQGIEAHIGNAASNRLNYIVGARYRSNGYLLNSLPVKGAYNPVFWDAQFLVNFAITEKLIWSTIAHFSSNNYRFSPQTAQTDFGTANEAYSFTIYFDGQEQTRFQTMMGGTALQWTSHRNKAHLNFYATVFNTDERENFDIQGQYYINELETDPSKEAYGDSIAVLGVGTFLNHARNRLNATIVNLYHHGDYEINNGFKGDDSLKIRSNIIKWGVNLQMDDFHDVLSEWKMIDSAGYSVGPGSSTPDQIELFETIKGKLDLKSQRFTSFVQLNSVWSKSQRMKAVEVFKTYRDAKGNKVKVSFKDTIVDSRSKWSLSIGTRGGYTSSNDEFFVTPRATVKFFPRIYMVDDSTVVRRNVVFKFSTGLYYQPPFYREFRTFDGNLNKNVLSQKSLHFVTGTDVYFNMWNREVPFKFTAEAYYKYLWNVNTYEIENVRTRYYANNDAVGYAYGADFNINGQFVKGIESFFKVGFLHTKEDVLTDKYTAYYNSAGERIFSSSEDQVVVDSAVIHPGYVPRPTDQWVNFGALIQDQMPGKFESISVQVGIQFGSRLPYGPPDYNRYRDTLRMKSYFRVDIGMSYDFLYQYKKKKFENSRRGPEDQMDVKESWWARKFEDAIISFEVFNLLGINNVLSKQWVQDTQGVYYSIPNYLTQRRFNLKLILRF